MPRSSTKPIVETFFEKLIQVGTKVSVDVITPHRQSCLTSTSLPTWLILLIRKQTLEAELGSQDSFRWIEPIFPQIHLEAGFPLWFRQQAITMYYTHGEDGIQNLGCSMRSVRRWSLLGMV
jgi:hypothetical protein